MIPKVIHYCWFGKNPKPKLAKKCIRSWKKYCRDYQIIEWNEDNFDIDKAPIYVQQAYEAGKWAFVTDYVRLYVVHKFGGIYLDTDVEILKELDDLLSLNAFFGFEDDNYVNTGLGFGAEIGVNVLEELMHDYQEIPFFLDNGELDLTPCPIRNTKVFEKNGLIRKDCIQQIEDGIKVFSQEYFCPKNYKTGDICITNNSYTIHHYDASWISAEEKQARIKKAKAQARRRKIKTIRSKFRRHIEDIIGKETYKKLRGMKDE